MIKINDLPTLERPREKALYYGIEQLADYELLAILIASGSKNYSAIDIAYFMLRDNSGLYNLVQKPFQDLLNYHGMGKAKAIKLAAAFELAKRFQNKCPNHDETIKDSNMIYERAKPLLSHSFYPQQENLLLIILNKKKKIIHEVNVSKGSESSVSASNMQIIQQVIMHSGKYFYIVHNHPSGEIEPSEDDIFFTVSLMKECSKFGIRMLDHLIISENGFYSFLRQEIYVTETLNQYDLKSEKTI